MASPLFSNIRTNDAGYDNVNCASYKGVTIKTFFLLAIAVIVAAMVVTYLPEILVNNFNGFYITLVVSSIVGLISVLVGRLSERLSKYFSVVYAVCEGLFLGTLTALLEEVYPGIALTAIFSTFIIFGVVLVLFATGIVKPTRKFRAICFAFVIGALLLTICGFVINMIVGVTGNVGILIAVEIFLLIYGAITLVLNFAEAQYLVDRGASKDAEWSVALGLTVSLIYIYVQALRFIALIASRRK